MNKEQFINEYQDIMSSGEQPGLNGWQMLELNELFARVGVTSILKDWINEMFTSIEDGVSGEEINWIAEKLGMKAAISFA